MATRTATRIDPQEVREGQRCVVRYLATLIAGLYLVHAVWNWSTVLPTGSMMPYLQGGDLIVSERFLFRLTGLKRHDIITFHQPGFEEQLAKRVVGLPGDTVEIRDGTVFIDGIPLAEDFVAEAPNYRFGPLTIPAGRVFVLGDNRNHSYDSHNFGPVPIERVWGRVWYRLRFQKPE